VLLAGPSCLHPYMHSLLFKVTIDGGQFGSALFDSQGQFVRPDCVPRPSFLWLTCIDSQCFCEAAAVASQSDGAAFDMAERPRSDFLPLAQGDVKLIRMTELPQKKKGPVLFLA